MIYIDYNYNKLVFIFELAGLRNNPSSKIRFKEWLKISGGNLSTSEKIFFVQLNKYLKSFNIYYIESMFMSYKGKVLQKKVSSYIGAEASDFLFNLLKIVDNRFIILWNKKKKNLEKIKSKIYLNNNFVLAKNAAIRLIHTSRIRSADVYLLISSNSKNDFSAWSSTVGKFSTIVIEGGIKERQANILAVYLHELIHVYLKDNKNLQQSINLIAKQIPKKIINDFKTPPAEKMLEEIIISSLSPEGILAQKYFNNCSIVVSSKPRLNKKSFYLLRRRVVYELCDLVNEYIKASRHIDLNFIKKILHEIKTV